MALAVLTLLALVVHGLGNLDASITISIPADIQEHHLEIDGPTYFRIVINYGSPKAWVVLRTFDDFHTLHEKLSKGAGYGLRPVPKGNVDYMTDDERTYYYHELGEWLQYTVDGTHSDAWKLVHEFLDPVSGAKARDSHITLPPDNFKKCAFTHYFGIHVADHVGGKGVKVFREFADFSKLRDELGDTATRAIPFPSGDVALEERRSALQTWLQEVTKSRWNDIAWEGALIRFLDPKLADEKYEARVSWMTSLFHFLPSPAKHPLTALVKMR